MIGAQLYMRFAAGWLGTLLCVLLCAAPCTAADARFFPSPIAQEAFSTASVDSIRASEAPLACDDSSRLLVPGVVSQPHPLPNLLCAAREGHVAAVSSRIVAWSEPSVAHDRAASPLGGDRGSARHLCLCVFLI